MGAVLSQVQDDGSRRLVAAASRSLNDAEEMYAAIELEALAICWAMEKFSQYVLGIEGVTIETDQKALVPLFGVHVSRQVTSAHTRVQAETAEISIFSSTCAWSPEQSS